MPRRDPALEIDLDVTMVDPWHTQRVPHWRQRRFTGVPAST